MKSTEQNELYDLKKAEAAAYYETIKGGFEPSVESAHMTGFLAGWEAYETILEGPLGLIDVKE